MADKKAASKDPVTWAQVNLQELEDDWAAIDAASASDDAAAALKKRSTANSALALSLNDGVQEIERDPLGTQ